MNKEIKIINYVFKFKDKLNLISVEEYLGYRSDESKLKLIIDDKYIEKSIKNINHTIDKLIFDNLIITNDSIELFIDEYHIQLFINNKELIHHISLTLIILLQYTRLH